MHFIKAENVRKTNMQLDGQYTGRHTNYIGCKHEISVLKVCKFVAV